MLEPSFFFKANAMSLFTLCFVLQEHFRSKYRCLADWNRLFSTVCLFGSIYLACDGKQAVRFPLLKSNYRAISTVLNHRNGVVLYLVGTKLQSHQTAKPFVLRFFFSFLKPTSFWRIREELMELSRCAQLLQFQPVSSVTPWTI